MNPIVYAIPVFFILIALEVVATAVRSKNYYRLNDALNSLSCGMLNVMTDLLVRVGIYSYVFNHLAIFEMSGQSWWVWIFAFVAQDFCYYWHHRKGHEINILWASHAVHHQSEEYNLTTALRQTSTSFLFSWIFYLPMAVLGVPPEVFAAVSLINLLYQFWVHTRHIPKLGWYEWFFVTPSNHRVHHAKNKKYLDKNYGGFLIIWDRLFGTFIEEDESYEAIRYGTLRPLRSWNPLWANMQMYAGMLSDAVRTCSWKERFTLWFRKTGYRPAGVSAPMQMPDIYAYKNYNPQVNRSVKIYTAIQFAVLIVMMTGLAGISHTTSYAFILLWTGVLAVNLMETGYLLECEGGHVQWETLRFSVTLLALLVSESLWEFVPQWLLVVVSGWAVLSLLVIKLMSVESLEERSGSRSI